jgi:hypothetical protein
MFTTVLGFGTCTTTNLFDKYNGAGSSRRKRRSIRPGPPGPTADNIRRERRMAASAIDRHAIDRHAITTSISPASHPWGLRARRKACRPTSTGAAENVI